jgi:hypothetical protein
VRIRDQLLRPLRRGRKIIALRWYLSPIVVLLMLPVVFAAGEAAGVYYTKADVLFVAPALSVSGNALQADPAETLSFASVTVHRFNADGGDTAPPSTSAPLYGSGIRTGHRVSRPRSGGQWQLSYDRPVITIEVVGESDEEVATERDHILNRISTLAKISQQEMGVKPAVYITTELARSTAFVTYVGVRNSRAEIALLFLTLGLAVGIPLTADRILNGVRTAAGSRRRTAVNGGAIGMLQKPEARP